MQCYALLQCSFDPHKALRSGMPLSAINHTFHHSWQAWLLAGVPPLTPWGTQPMPNALRSSASYTGSFSSSAASEGRHSQQTAQENVGCAVDKSIGSLHRCRDAYDIGCLVDNTPFVKVKSCLSGKDCTCFHAVQQAVSAITDQLMQCVNRLCTTQHTTRLCM